MTAVPGQNGVDEMQTALDGDGLRVTPGPGALARCPLCRGQVRAKCGRIVVWHWAHIADECDSWAEPDSEWHRDWQRLFPIECREVVIGAHRADVKTGMGVIVELQDSYLSPDDIEEREEYYGPRMVWVFNAIEPFENERLLIRAKNGNWQDSYRTFRWKHGRKTIAFCRRPVYLDLGEGRLVKLGKMYTDGKCAGWGFEIDKEDFLYNVGANFHITKGSA